MALSGSFYNYVYQQFGLYCEWSGVQNIPGNYTDITLNVYVSYYTLNIGTKTGTVSINGTSQSFTSPEIRDMSGGSHKRVLVATKTQRVNHNTDGTKADVGISVTWNCALTYHDTYYSSITASTSVTLNAIDRNAPTVSLVVENISVSGARLTVVSSDIADNFVYRLNSGSWVQFSTQPGYSASVELSDLTPNTTYTIAARARRAYNQVYGTSPSVTITTKGGSVLTWAGQIVANSATPKLQFAMMVYNSTYTHTLVVRKDSLELFRITGITGGTGSNTKAYDLSAAQARSIMNAMPSETQTELTLELLSYSNGTAMGSSSLTATAIVTEAAAPTLVSFTVYDGNSDVTDVTGNNAIIVQNASTVHIAVNAVPAQGTDIGSYSVTIGDRTVVSAEDDIEFGLVNVSDSVKVTVVITDERGLSSSQMQTINVIPYEPVALNSWSISREYNVGTTATLDFAGKFSPIVISNRDRNSLSAATYRVKVSTASSYGPQYDVLARVTVAGSDFSYSRALAQTFQVDSAYFVEVSVSDQLTSATVTLYVTRGKPLMSFRTVFVGDPDDGIREGRVGINTNDPQSPLDVDGIIRMNGYNVMGFIKTLDGGTDLNDVVDIGVYAQPQNGNTSLAHHYPEELAGFLEVFAEPSGHVLQRYTIYEMQGVYMRYRWRGIWSNWLSVTLT